MSFEHPTLLYIDDDEALARLVHRGLTRHGFGVLHAASGAEGLDRIAKGGVDVVALGVQKLDPGQKVHVVSALTF